MTSSTIEDTILDIRLFNTLSILIHSDFFPRAKKEEIARLIMVFHKKGKFNGECRRSINDILYTLDVCDNCKSEVSILYYTDGFQFRCSGCPRNLWWGRENPANYLVVEERIWATLYWNSWNKS